MAEAAQVDFFVMWFVVLPLIHITLIGIPVVMNWRRIARGKARIWTLYTVGGTAFIWPLISLFLGKRPGALADAAVLAAGVAFITVVAARSQLNWWNVMEFHRRQKEQNQENANSPSAD